MINGIDRSHSYASYGISESDQIHAEGYEDNPVFNEAGFENNAEGFGPHVEEEQSWIGSVLGKIWSIPNTLIGLGWGLLGTLFGAKISFGNNAVQFEDHPFMFDGGAITLGNAIVYGKGSGPALDGDHERQHTYQAQAMGPLYLIGHLIEGVQALANDGHWHGKSNDLEAGPMDIYNRRPWR